MRLTTQQMPLMHKKLLITGGTSGIGKAVAMASVQQGAHVAFCGLTDEGTADVMSARIDSDQSCFFRAFDIADQGQTRQFVRDAIQALGGLDGVVSNAGTNFFHGIETATYEDIMRCFHVNFFPAWVIAQETYEALKACGQGKFIVVTSIHGTMSLPGAFPYDVSKAALSAFVRSIALAWSKDNIQSAAIAPGLVNTPLVADDFSKTTDPEATWDKYRRWHPLRREGSPEDIAGLVVYLLSDHNRFITGATIMVDGGLHVQIAHD
jgi:NAD(P)-dependent dehydrogenase (short-subunit alcohol dehydrogenase family)